MNERNNIYKETKHSTELLHFNCFSITITLSDWSYSVISNVEVTFKAHDKIIDSNKVKPENGKIKRLDILQNGFEFYYQKIKSKFRTS